MSYKKSFLLFIFFTLFSIQLYSQSYYIEGKSEYSNYIKLNKVYNTTSNGKTMTVIVLDFLETNNRKGTLYAPGKLSAYYLFDNNNKVYDLIKQEGWNGNKEGGYGERKLNTNFSIKLYFSPITFKEDTKFDLIEGRSTKPWNIYGIRYSKTKSYKELEAIAKKHQKKEYYDTGELKGIGNYNLAGEKMRKWTEYHKNGKISGIGYYSNRFGKKTGKWKEYYKNGQLKFDGSYTVSRNPRRARHGKCISYWKNGKLKEEATYIRGNKVGPYKMYHDSGKEEEIFSADGSYRSFFPNGTPYEIGQYDLKSGKATGKWKKYYKNGQLKFDGGYYQGDKNYGDCITYWENGKIKEKATYNKKGKKIGSYTTYYENGTIIETGRYDTQGEKSGVWKYYYEDNSKKRTIEYEKEKKYAVWKEFDNKGRLIEQAIKGLMSDYKYRHTIYKDFNEKGMANRIIIYKNEKIDQNIRVLKYHTNSKIAEAVFTTKGKNGLKRQYATFFENENLSAVADLNEKGQRHGKFTFFYKNKKVIQTVLMENGKWMEVIECFDMNGNPIKKGTLKNGNGTILLYNVDTGKQTAVWNFENGTIKK